MSPESDLTVLLGQAGWTRALARRLASDADLAEDLAQDAWVVALERPPELGRPVRGWLASVLRRRWVDLSRARERRRDRERTAASGAAAEAWPSAHDVVERAAVQRELVGAVLELDEPYRTTILLRFFEELPQREIARRMRTTSATVNSRITRALARLRERMSRGREAGAWLQVLVPSLREPATASAAAIGALAMKIVLTSVAVAASILAGIVLWTSQRGAAPGAGLATPPAATAATERESRPSIEVVVEPPGALPEPRIPLTSGAVPLATPASPRLVPVARTVRGRVLDPSGVALSGIRLGLSAPDSKASCASDAGGWFEITLDVEAEAIVCADPGYVTVLAGSARVHEPTRPTVVVAPRIDLAGIVIDEAGAPLADVALELQLPAGFGAEWSLALDYSLPQRWRAASRPDGRFELGGLPVVEGSAIHAALSGFAPHVDAAPLRSTSVLEIVLARPHESEGLVQGVVVDAAGARAEGARVSAGAGIVLTDGRGEFTLDVRPQGTGARLVALKPGLLPAVFEPERDPDGRLLWPTSVVLRLGTPPGTVFGRVVDANGTPIAGARVWLDDPTPFGCTDDARVVAESLLRGDERFWSFETTSAEGTFSIGGLLPRAYRLQALDPRTLASVESAPVFAADSPVELRLPTGDVHARVAGRVVSAGGQPLAGVRVRLFRITYELEHEGGTDNESAESDPVVTAEDGAFEFRNVPRRGVELIATGDTILGASASLAEEADPERIEIVASRRLHLQVELDEPHGRADRLRVFDAQGGRVFLSVFHGSGAHADFEMPILDGRSDVLAVAEDAEALALFRGEEEVARLPLHLVPGQTNVVRY